MKTKKHYFILVTVATILCFPARGQEELPRRQLAQHLWDVQQEFDEKPFLIGRANPALAGIEELYIDVVPSGSDPAKDGLVWKELETKVINRLHKAGMKGVGNIKTLTTAGLSISELSGLRVDMDMVKLVDSQQYVFHIRTSLARTVTFPAQPNLHLQVDAWKTEPVMEVISTENMPDRVTDVVLEQVEAFVLAYLAANPKDVQSADANDIAATTGPTPAWQADKSIAAKYKYISSKNSKVFHKPDCASANRIKPTNLISYNSRDEAVKAGKRPCKRCKP